MDDKIFIYKNVSHFKDALNLKSSSLAMTDEDFELYLNMWIKNQNIKMKKKEEKISEIF